MKIVELTTIAPALAELLDLAGEDKLLQLAVARLLEAIYEQDFLRCSYGYRPHVGALEAVDTLTIKLQFGRYAWVVEGDITKFFDTIDHD